MRIFMETEKEQLKVKVQGTAVVNQSAHKGPVLI